MLGPVAEYVQSKSSSSYSSSPDVSSSSLKLSVFAGSSFNIDGFFIALLVS